MNGINRVFLLGEVMAAPQMASGDGRSPVLNFELVTKESRKKGTLESETPEYHQLELSGGQVQAGLKLLHQGTTVYVEGRVATSWFWDQAGVKHYLTKIKVHHFTLPGRVNDFR